MKHLYQQFWFVFSLYMNVQFSSWCEMLTVEVLTFVFKYKYTYI